MVLLCSFEYYKVFTMFILFYKAPLMRFDVHFCEQPCFDVFDGTWKPARLFVMCINIRALGYPWHLYICFCDRQVV